MRNYYMVRAQGSKEEDFKEFFDKNIIAVGWSNVDFSKENDINKLRDLVNEKYYNNRISPYISKKLNEIERFKGIKKGDYIIIPFYSSIVIAEAEDLEKYESNAIHLDLANQRAVSYKYLDSEPMRIARSDLSEGLQRRLRVRGNTVTNLNEFKDEIDKIFQTNGYSFIQNIMLFEEEKCKELKKQLLHKIQNGETNLQTGGIGLENLVSEIMQCEGYRSKVLPKNKFSGSADADIEAIKEDSFMSKKIFVQVKHHSGNSGKEGIEQIVKVLKCDEYKDHDGYFITSADINDDVRKFASENGIEVMDGMDLVELIIANLNRLSNKTKYQLGICSIPLIKT